MNSHEILAVSPYSLNRSKKQEFLIGFMRQLSEFHYEHCAEYKRILDGLNVKIASIQSLDDVPFLPVRLFKEYELRSIGSAQVMKTMNSS